MDITGGDVVEAALRKLGECDIQQAELAGAAFSSLNCDVGLGSVTMFRLCEWLWQELPRTPFFTFADHLRIAESLSVLFTELGMPRYAELCTGDTTQGVLAAWDEGRDQGIKAAAKALAVSGVEPPNVPGVLQWSTFMGPEETCAFLETAARLEIAVAAGAFRPGTRGWRGSAVLRARQYLDNHPAGTAEPSLLDRIYAERLAYWARSRGRRRGEMTAVVGECIAGTPRIPDDAELVLTPVRWLLAAANGDGSPLTRNLGLSRDLLVEGRQRFGWLAGTAKPRSEFDVPEVGALRSLVAGMGATRRLKRRLLLTPHGRRLVVADTPTLWREVTRGLIPADRPGAATSEIVLMHYLTAKNPSYGEQIAAVTEAMAGEGWQREHSERPVDHRAVRWLMHEMHVRLDLLHLIEQGPVGRCLTPAGVAAALSALRAYALRPRTDPSPC